MKGRELMPASPGQPMQISTVERLRDEHKRLLKRVADLEEAQKILADNPQIERLLTIISGQIY